MKTNLSNYFPMIQTREEILSQIHSSAKLNHQYSKWNEPQQKEFLDFCSGSRGVKILYNTFVKELLNPETVPERLNDLLSILLGEHVTILKALPTDNNRIADEDSLLEMDFLVQLEDGRIVNVEIQKIGYNFPGERSACYSSDLLLRQYKTSRSASAKSFSYKKISEVYTIVFFEKSPQTFKKYPDHYIHRFEQKSDTGLELQLLQKYIFIPLDIFMKHHHNKGINNKQEAWMTFLASDSPEDIISLITSFPEFKPIYEHLYNICYNIEEVMSMFSEELRILDRNTVHLMIDEMQEEIRTQAQTIQNQQAELEAQKAEVERLKARLEQLKISQNP